MNDDISLFSVQASTFARQVDHLFLWLLALSAAVTLGVAVTMITFCIRYRAGTSARRARPRPHRALELSWTVLPLLAFLVVYARAASLFASLYKVPPNAMPVFVVARQWMWKTQHSSGRREIDELHLPLGKPVRLIMTSEDVIHSLFIPAFRIKQDVVPGRYTSITFTPTLVGEYRLFCSEFCGLDHARMGGRVVVMAAADFQRWLSQGNTDPDMAARGFELFRSHGCSGCHEAGSSVHAPSLDGIFGSTVHLQDGRSIVADESYLRDSMLLPGKDVVAGFSPVMPSFQGQLDEGQILDLIEYLKSRQAPSP